MGWFHQEKTITGNVVIEDVPHNYGMIVSLAFFPVKRKDDPPPHGTYPEEQYIKDTYEIMDTVNLDRERTEHQNVIPYTFTKKPGYYYVQIRAILFRKNSNNVFAQTEQFFFEKRPLEITDHITNLELPVRWPSIPLEQLGSYGVIQPD